MDIEKRIQELRDRLKYILDIFGPDENINVTMLEAKLGEFIARESDLPKQEAVRQLAEASVQGGVVLLSPACASMDMFRNYAHRAQVFADAVKEIALSRGEVTA